MIWWLHSIQWYCEVVYCVYVVYATAAAYPYELGTGALIRLSIGVSIGLDG
jgi:hypothetical protein